MGLLKRLFSFGVKSKSKSKAKTDTSNQKPLLAATPFASNSTNDLLTPTRNHDLDVAMNRLLRTSSTHFSVLSETDYTDLPPICEIAFLDFLFLF